ncbi:hypothetical protein DFJ77DRAFT_43570 [Powellomyces hirtus]|nr:hypothetical protein DFJ77DRAFT_43570 [Powellomyces hirtus]
MDGSDGATVSPPVEGNPSTTSKLYEFPTWTFPTGAPQSTGTLSGLSLRFPDVDFQCDDGFDEGWHSSFSRPKRVKSASRAWAPRGEANSDRMVSFYEATGAPSVPRNLLRECLEESLQVEREYDDPFAGNCLDVVDGTAVFAAGKAFGEVCAAQVNFGKESLQPASTIARFQNPVLQLSFGATIPHSRQRLFAARNHASISILALGQEDSDTDGWDARVVDVIPFEHRPLHVAFNSVLPAEVAVVLDGGDICVWNGEREARTSLIAKYDECLPVYNRKWKSCQYGSHLRTLVVAHVDRVDTVDFRSRAIVPATVFESTSTELIRAFKRDPQNPYQIVLATSVRTLVVDSRFPGRNLLEWDYQHNRETPCGIEFMPAQLRSPHVSSFVTWSRIYGEIQAYTYGTPALSTDSASLTTMNANPGTLHDLISPSWTLPPMSLSRPALLDPFYLSPQFAAPGRPYAPAKHQRQLKEKEARPEWPFLRGMGTCPLADGRVLVLQLADDGAIYSQPVVDELEASVDTPDESLRTMEANLDTSLVQKTEASVVAQYKDHEHVNWTSLARFLDLAAQHVDHRHMEPSSDIVQADLQDNEREHGQAVALCTFWEQRSRLASPSVPFMGAVEPASIHQPGLMNPSTLENMFTEHGHSKGTHPLTITIRGLLPATPAVHNLASVRDAVCDYLGLSHDADDSVLRDYIAQDVCLAGMISGFRVRQFLEDEVDPTPELANDAIEPASQAPSAFLSQVSSHQLPLSQMSITSSVDDGDHDDASPILCGATLITPYTPLPIKLSSAANELRKRWMTPTDYYGPAATRGERVRAMTPGAAQRGKQKSRPARPPSRLATASASVELQVPTIGLSRAQSFTPMSQMSQSYRDQSFTPMSQMSQSYRDQSFTPMSQMSQSYREDSHPFSSFSPAAPSVASTLHLPSASVDTVPFSQFTQSTWMSGASQQMPQFSQVTDPGSARKKKTRRKGF